FYYGIFIPLSSFSQRFSKLDRYSRYGYPYSTIALSYNVIIQGVNKLGLKTEYGHHRHWFHPVIHDIRKFDAYSVITRDEIGFKYFTNASEFNHHRIFSKCCNFYSDMWLPFGSIFPKSGYDSRVNFICELSIIIGIKRKNVYKCLHLDYGWANHSRDRGRRCSSYSDGFNRRLI